MQFQPVILNTELYKVAISTINLNISFKIPSLLVVLHTGHYLH